MTNAVETARVDRISRETEALIAEMRKTNDSLRALTDDPKMQKMPAELSATVSDIRRTTRLLDSLIAGNQSGITETVENMRQVSQDMKELTANARQYPSLIFFGDPPGQSGGPKK